MHTHDRVLLAAATVFDRLGFAASRLQDISVEAGVSTGALYAHYRSKTDLMVAIVTEHNASGDRLFAESATWNIPAVMRLERLITELARCYQSDIVSRAAIRLQDDYSRSGGTLLPQPMAWADRVAQILREGGRDGSVSSSIDCDVVARVLVSSFYGIQHVSYQTTGRRDLADRVDEWWQLMSLPLTELSATPKARRQRALPSIG